MLLICLSQQSKQPFLRYDQNSVRPWKKHIRNYLRKFAWITVSKNTFPKSNQVTTMTRAIKLPRCVVMSGSSFIVQKSKFSLINCTAVTLCQGHWKVIQYISPDLHILCSKYLKFSWYSFDVAAADAAVADAADATNWKRTENIKSTQTDLIIEKIHFSKKINPNCHISKQFSLQ